MRCGNGPHGVVKVCFKWCGSDARCGNEMRGVVKARFELH